MIRDDGQTPIAFIVFAIAQGASRVEAGNYQNPILLDLVEYAVGEPAHSSAPAIAMHDRELQRALGNCVHRFIDSGGEAVPELRAYVVIPRSSVV